MEPDADVDRVAKQVIGAAIEVHRRLGPGFPENVYGNALAIELNKTGLSFEKECPVAVVYDGQVIGEGRIDFLIERRLIVELKTVEKVSNVHLGQVISYLKMTKLPLGLILNFHTSKMKDGIHRVVYTQS